MKRNTMIKTLALSLILSITANSSAFSFWPFSKPEPKISRVQKTWNLTSKTTKKVAQYLWNTSKNAKLSVVASIIALTALTYGIKKWAYTPFTFNPYSSTPDSSTPAKILRHEDKSSAQDRRGKLKKQQVKKSAPKRSVTKHNVSRRKKITKQESKKRAAARKLKRLRKKARK